MSVTIAAYKRCPVRRYLQLFVWGLISYLRYLYLVANSGVQHILCCVFVLFVFVLCTIWCQCLWIVHWWLSFRCSPTFIQKSKSGYWFDTNQMYIIKNVTCSRHGKNSFLQWSIASIAELTLLFSFVFVIVYLKHKSKND